MPTGIYKRKNKTNKSLPKNNELVITTTATIDIILDLVKQIKKNKIGKIK